MHNGEQGTFVCRYCCFLVTSWKRSSCELFCCGFEKTRGISRRLDHDSRPRLPHIGSQGSLSTATLELLRLGKGGWKSGEWRVESGEWSGKGDQDCRHGAVGKVLCRTRSITRRVRGSKKKKTQAKKKKARRRKGGRRQEEEAQSWPCINLSSWDTSFAENSEAVVQSINKAAEIQTALMPLLPSCTPVPLYS